jgi:Spy/CpxP family protein refolding chaperone
MKIKILIGVLILLIAINLGTLGSYLYLEFVRKPPPPGWERPPRPEFHGPDRPGFRLDREQRHQLAELLQEIYQESRSLREELWKTERVVLELVRQDTLPMEQIDNNLQRMADLRLQMIRIALGKLQRAKSFLTPEQQERFFNAIMMARPGAPEPGNNMMGRPPHPNFGPKWKQRDSLMRREK